MPAIVIALHMFVIRFHLFHWRDRLIFSNIIYPLSMLVCGVVSLNVLRDKHILE